MSTPPKILLIYTGGTIGMIKDVETRALIPFDFKQLLQHIPELRGISCQIETLSFEVPIDSSDMDIGHWKALGDLIYTHYNKYDGFVVLHGSDTMAYTASAVSFMFENLRKPIIFTGSQLPIGDLRTDAKENVITAIQIVALQEDGVPVVQEVGVYFEYKLLRGNRSTKVSTTHFKAFASPNYPPLVTSGVALTVHKSALYRPEKTNAALRYFSSFDPNIVVITVFPGMTRAVFTPILESKMMSGVIILTFGSGNATTQSWFIEAISALVARGIPVVNITQCITGTVIMGQYATSIGLQNVGVISGKDLTLEAAIAKLMLLLGKKIPSNLLKTTYETGIRGELS